MSAQVATSVRRRLLIISEFQATGIIAENRMEQFEGRSDAKVQNGLSSDIENGERTVRGTLEELCQPDEIRPYEGAICSVEIQYECEKHPNHWSDKPGEKCDKCKMGPLNGNGHG